MIVIARRIWNEPAIAIGIPTILFATASGVWSVSWLAFAAAATAALGTMFVRQNSTPMGLPRDRSDS